MPRREANFTVVQGVSFEQARAIERETALPNVLFEYCLFGGKDLVELRMRDSWRVRIVVMDKEEEGLWVGTGKPVERPIGGRISCNPVAPGLFPGLEPGVDTAGRLQRRGAYEARCLVASGGEHLGERPNARPLALKNMVVAAHQVRLGMCRRQESNVRRQRLRHGRIGRLPEDGVTSELVDLR